jgi:branched-chain amino acid transport system substrate-binding protein
MSQRSGSLGSAGAIVAALAVVVSLALVACGDDDSSDSASAGGGSSASTQPSGSAVGDATAGSGVTDYLKYTGGKAGPADKSTSPIVIGWVNQQGGPSDVGPGATKGAEMAVKYINEELGGIDGHPLALHTCFTSTTEEQGQTCGQKLANDRAVQVVGVGAVAIGGQSLVATIDAQKPMVYSVAVGPADPTNKNGYILFGDAIHVSAPFGTYARDVLHAKSAAVVYPQQPGIEAGSNAMVQGLKDAGVSVKRVSWNPNATDLVGPLTAAGAQSADVLMPNADPKSCVNLAKTIASLKLETPVVSQPLCLNAEVAKGLGDLPKWTYGIASSLATDTKDPAAVAFMKVADQYGVKEAAGDVWIPIAFTQILTIAQWMNQIGADTLSSEAITAKAKAFKGPMAFGAPTLECGKYADAPAICNDQIKFFNYEGKGVFSAASGWVRPPE